MQKKLRPDVFILILAILIGILAGISASLLKTFVYKIDQFVTNFSIENEIDFLYLIAPGIGILLTWVLFKYVIKDETKHGIPRILFVISRLDGKMKYHKAFSSMIGGALTAGFGGSIGLESPIISSGSSFGSGIGQILKLNFKTKTLLIGCGAAGAMASIFTTPVAAIVFALEVLMLDLTIASIIPLLVASATGAITARLLTNEALLFNFSSNSPFDISDLPFYLVFGILGGLVSLYFSHMHFIVANIFSKFKSFRLKIFVGALSLGILIFLFPALYSEGYEMIRHIMNGEAELILTHSYVFDFRNIPYVFLIYIILLILLKIIATSITIEAGGIGGIFAPAAVTGGLLGFLYSRVINTFSPTTHLHEDNFTLVGMSTILAAVLHAPLTAIFLVVEMTNGYGLIVPLMLTTSIAYVTNRTFNSHSIFTKQLAEQGDLITHHKDNAVLTLLQVNHVIDKDLLTIKPGSTLGDLTKLISKSKRNIFPIVDEHLNYSGLIDMDDVREVMFQSEKYGCPIDDFKMQSKEHVSTKDAMETVMQKFKNTGYYNLPVVDNGKYIGFVSRANIFTAYRKMLNELSDH
ncbi:MULTISPECIES: chloride channel protein [unclassified Lentimicrobium]|uniref:chloride channel protein n=1 Tax=unclassified Lentimicrobium TaxID=2677434 RepID=UPI0015575367|nr:MULTISPECIES: chloride channel protein [unclassified Lentimicrobium]NPD44788.1 chloride channel protein [Lentimicrobium sp. S6]NPD83195.1 chloride channel protein [Lentimicrobium sp. L6]